MGLKSKKLIILILVFILLVGVLTIYNVYHVNVSHKPIRATVVSIKSQPNIAEDGYYGITVKNYSGEMYSIDATGSLNIPDGAKKLTTCLNMPKIHVNDNVTFSLPLSKTEPDTFITCYNKYETSYYFTVN